MGHAIIGYIAYSLFIHAIYRDSPTGRETLVVVFAALFPDLIDKPLTWQFGVFEGSYASGHLVFFAVPLSVAIVVLTYERGRPRSGWAFGIGYVLHLPFDMVPSAIGSGDLPTHRVLWPIEGDGSQQDSFFDGFLTMVVPYVCSLDGQLLSGDPSSYMLFVLGLGGCGFLLWIYDGMPVVREGYIAVCDRARRSDVRGPRSD